MKLLEKPQVLLTFDQVHNPLRLPRKTTSERPKVFRTPQSFALLTSKCASRHNCVHFFDMSTSKVFRDRQLLTLLTLKCASRHHGVHFFDISTSKSAPTLRCFAHFDLEMCFAPQRRALFRHLNLQKCSEREVFLAISFAHVLRATKACNFSSLIWSDCSAPAALTCFSTLRSHKPLDEHSVLRLSYLFFFFLMVSSLILFLLLFSSLPFPSLPFPSLRFASLLFSSLLFFDLFFDLFSSLL